MVSPSKMLNGIGLLGYLAFIPLIKYVAYPHLVLY
jgi:hypothetical protein